MRTSPRRARVVLVAASTDLLGGQAVQARTLLDAARGEGWHVELLPANPRLPAVFSRLASVRYARTAVREACFALSLRALQGADVVHVFTASYWSFLLVAAPVLLAARARGLRTILNYHSGEADDHLSRFGPLVHPWLRLADTLVVPSEYLKTVFERHGHAARVIRNVVPLDRFRFRPRTRLRPRLLSNRNLEPHYRVEDTIRAHARIRRRHPDARLVVAGTGSEDVRLRRLAESLAPGSVDLVGRVEPTDMPALYAANDVFVNASVVDNQPLSVLEAFACGLPVVTTPTGDLAAMVPPGAGLLVPPRDPGALADAVESLLADGERACAMAARARDEAMKYQWSAVRAEWSELWRGAA